MKLTSTANPNGHKMKKVNCFDCNKEINYADAAPKWDMDNPGPPTSYTCKECLSLIPKAKDGDLIRMLLKASMQKYKKIKDENNQI